MKKMYISLKFLSILLTAIVFAHVGRAQFTTGRLVVLQVGDGSGALSNAATPVFLKEYTTTGTAGVSVTMPVTGSTRLTISGTSTSDGQMTLSPDGRFLTIAGYDAATGTAAITGTTSAAANRVINTADATGTISRAASTNSLYSANNFRSAVKSSSADYWGAGGTTGTYYFGTTAAAATVQNTITNTRVVNIFNGNLYFATGSGTAGVYGFSGLPQSTATATLLAATGAGSSPYAFAINTAGNVLYIADDRTTGAGGVQKWTFNGTAWSLAYTFVTAANIGARGLAVDFSGTNPVLYATTTDNKLVSFTDAGAASAATTLVTAATNTAFRGVCFAPAPPPALPAVNLSVSSNAGSEAAATVITVTATATAPVSGAQTVSVGVSGTDITAGDYTLSNATITIPNGATTGSVTFTVVDDALAEVTETAVLTISSPSAGITLGTTVTQNITITDNDTPLPVVNLSVSANTGTEENATLITVTATASAPVSGNQTVALGVSGTGITAFDYTLSGTTITIPNGTATGTVSFKIRNDAETEGNETAVLTISSPSAGITPGTTITQNISITDFTCQPLIRKSTASSVNGAEISAFDPLSGRVFTVAGAAVEYYTLSNAGILSAPTSMPFGFTSAGNNIIPNSVAVKNGIVAVSYAIQNTATLAQNPGIVAFYQASSATFLNSVVVGYLPDMLIFSPDGTKVLTANEGEPNSYGQGNSFDPEGSVSIIDISGGVGAATVQTAGFTSFNGQMAALKAAGVRIYGPGATVAQDLEPEYIAFSSDATKAYVTLQENNAVAEIDIAAATVTQVLPLGLKNHSIAGRGLDASDQDGGINIQNWPVYGMYQPDAIAGFTVGGTNYFITANEGDSRNYTGYSEEIRVGNAAYVLDPAAFPNAATLKLNQNLGRLQLSNATGDTDNDGDIDQIHLLGARSFSIWNSSFTQLFDSGDQLEQITAQQNPARFNADNINNLPATFDTRSDNKGPEPEAVTTGIVNGVLYAFVGSERSGDIFVYDISNPNAPVFKQYIDNPLDFGVEGLLFVPANESPTGKALLISSAEISNTVTVYEFSLIPGSLATTNTSITATQDNTTSYGDCNGLIAKLVQQGGSPVTGSVNARVWIEGTVPAQGGIPFVQRHYEITPASGAATATGRVTLYFTQAEFDNFNNDPASAADLPSGPADAAGISNLRVIKYPGVSNDGSGLPGSYTGTPLTINPDDADITWNAAAARWEVVFEVTGFSGFIVQTGTVVLPLTLLSQSVQAVGNDALVQWKTVDEINHAYYEVQASGNGQNFAGAGHVLSQPGNGQKQYTFTHTNAISLGNKVYYRLKMVSVAGAVVYSNIMLVRFGAKGQLITDVFPNPVTDRVNIVTTGISSSQPVRLRIADLGGRIVGTKQVTGNGTISIDMSSYTNGVYFLEAELPDGTKQRFKLVKQ